MTISHDVSHLGVCTPIDKWKQPITKQVVTRPITCIIQQFITGAKFLDCSVPVCFQTTYNGIKSLKVSQIEGFFFLINIILHNE